LAGFLQTCSCVIDAAAERHRGIAERSELFHRGKQRHLHRDLIIGIIIKLILIKT